MTTTIEVKGRLLPALATAYARRNPTMVDPYTRFDLMTDAEINALFRDVVYGQREARTLSDYEHAMSILDAK